MKTYEVTYIISSQIPSEQVNTLSKEVESFIQSKEGVILKSDQSPNGGKAVAQTLAYPIKKQSSGYFVTLTFQILENKLKELKEKLEKETNILRHFIIVKKPIKELKKRRTRKPLTTTEDKSTNIDSQIFTDASKKKSEKIDLDKIDKKLDEILSE